MEFLNCFIPRFMVRYLLLLILAGTLLLPATGCQKAELRDIENQEDKWLGTWEVTEIKTVTTDTLGNVRSELTAANQGTVEFRKAPGGTAGDAFKPAIFEGACANAEMVRYFADRSSGDRTATRGWAIYWDADPDGARVLLWAIGPLSSYHRTITMDSDDDHARQLYYTYRLAANQLVFTTWSLRK
jgi:hypothetical protein